MHIAFVSTEYKRTGIGQFTYNLAKALRELNHNVNVFVRTRQQPAEEWFTPVKSFGALLDIPLFSFVAAARIRNERADVWHADYVDAGYACFLARKRPFVVTIHDVTPLVLPKTRHPLWLFFFRRWLKACERADAIVTVSQAAKSDAIKYAGISEEKLFAIHNGVDHSRFYPPTKKEKKMLTARDKIRIGYCGGLDPRKRVDRLIEAFATLNKKYHNLELLIAGSGKQLAKLRHQAQLLGLRNVHFLGYVPDMKLREFYISLDVFASASDYEGFGLPFVEAMACGVPIVAINRSAMPEVVGSAGLLTQPSVDGFAEALEQLIIDEQLRKKKATQALQRAKRFSWYKSARQFLKLYQSLLSH